MGAGLPRWRREQGRALRHRLRGAADRIGHVEVGDRAAEGRVIDVADDTEIAPRRLLRGPKGAERRIDRRHARPRPAHQLRGRGHAHAGQRYPALQLAEHGRHRAGAGEEPPVVRLRPAAGVRHLLHRHLHLHHIRLVAEKLGVSLPAVLLLNGKVDFLKQLNIS